MRKNARTPNSFPNDEALIKSFYGVLKNVAKKWLIPIRDWKAALNRLTIECDERMKLHGP